jgi:tetratricopeptide (TPR) repeat protein
MRLPARTPGRDDVASPQSGQLFGSESPARSEMESRIVELFQADKFAEVIPLLETVVKEAREEFMGWYLLGVSYRMVGRYDDAIRALGQATKYALTQTEFGEAHLRRGIAWYYKGEPRVAIGDFDEAASAATNDARPEFWKGLIMASEGRYRDAITAYSNALRLSQGYNAARNNRGLAYLAMNELDFAITDFNEVIRRSPDDASAYYKRAIALGRRGDFRDAVESYNNAIRLNPKFAAAYYNRGLVHQRLGNSQQAQADMARARQINPQVGGAPRSSRLAIR